MSANDTLFQATASAVSEAPEFDRDGDGCESPTGIEAEVCADIAARQRKGIAKYGTTVADNPLPLKEWLRHAYEEAIDKAVYLKRAIREIEQQEGIQTKQWARRFMISQGTPIKESP